jgi:hypothetical protein
MHFTEEYIHLCNTMIPWKAQRIVKYTWILRHEDTLERDLELWLCEPIKQLEPMRLKIKAHDVSNHAYATLSSGWIIALHVQLNEHMHYVFMDTYEDVSILFTCKNFTFQLEEAAYDEL